MDLRTAQGSHFLVTPSEEERSTGMVRPTWSRRPLYPLDCMYKTETRIPHSYTLAPGIGSAFVLDKSASVANAISFRALETPVRYPCPKATRLLNENLAATSGGNVLFKRWTTRPPSMGRNYGTIWLAVWKATGIW